MIVKHIEARAIHKRRNKVVKIMQNNKISIFPFYIRKSFFLRLSTVWIKRSTPPLLVKVKNLHSRMFIIELFFFKCKNL